MGTMISAGGMRPDDAKLKAIASMPKTTDKDGVRRLIGMLNYLSPFTPNKAAIIRPLCALLKDSVPWVWLPENKATMNRVKLTLSEKPVLKLYDPELPVTIQADSSSKGLGACLLQNYQPVAYASRALTDTESRYAQIEKELLCIVFAAERFRKAHEEGRDFWVFLLQYRNTPITGAPYSPAQLLMSRQLHMRDKMPSTSNTLKPAVVTDGRSTLRRRQTRQKHFYDRGTTTRAFGDNVRVRLYNT